MKGADMRKYALGTLAALALISGTTSAAALLRAF
jgi:hypothetical protein